MNLQASSKGVAGLHALVRIFSRSSSCDHHPASRGSQQPPSYELTQLEDILRLAMGALSDANCQLCYLCSTHYDRPSATRWGFQLFSKHHAIDEILAEILETKLGLRSTPDALRVANKFVLHKHHGKPMELFVSAAAGRNDLPVELARIAANPEIFPVLSRQVTNVSHDLQKCRLEADGRAVRRRHRLVLLNLTALRRRLEKEGVAIALTYRLRQSLV